MFTQNHTQQRNNLFAEDLKTTPRRKRNKWSCNLDEVVIGDYLIVPLTSSRMLQSEAYWMANCCRDYTRDCAELTYSIFSIRTRTGDRLATLGLSHEMDHWSFDQCYGPCNSDVLEETHEYLDENGQVHSEIFPTELYYVAHEVVRLMNGGNQSLQ